MFIGAIGCEPLQLARVHLENSRALEVYRRNGGYQAIRKVLDSMSPDDVIGEVKKTAMRGRGGVIINIGSLAGAIAFPGMAAYCASKAGIDGLTRALAYDWAGDNIRVLCVAPGYVKSDISKDVLADERKRDWVLRRIPLRRVAEPEEIAEFVAFLASDAARFCTGETYYVDGGQRMAI